MSVLNKSIELVLEYRKIIAEVEATGVTDKLRDRAEAIWDAINTEFLKIPAGHEDLNTGKLFVRGFGFPFRGTRVKFGDALPEYSLNAVARELLGWDTDSTIEKNIDVLNEIEPYHDVTLEEQVRNLFLEVSEPLKATPEQPVAYVDLETTGPHPAVSEIIECGMVVDYGDYIREFSELYSLRDESAIVGGVLPYEDCHHITPDVIDGKPKWSDATEIHEILSDPSTVLVAHHIEFESRWFAHTVPDFMRNRSPYFSDLAGTQNQARAFDSRFAAAFISDAERGTLESLVEFTGSEYVDAHRALNDVKMMKTALGKL